MLPFYLHHVRQQWGDAFPGLPSDQRLIEWMTSTLLPLCVYLKAKPRRKLKNKLMRLHHKFLSRKRSIIETINDQLQNISQIEYSRHRSPVNFGVNLLCELIAYCHQPQKPSLRLDWLLPPSAQPELRLTILLIVDPK